MANELFKPMDRDALMRQAREKARQEADRRWPPGFQYLRQRQREEDDLTMRYFREYTGAFHD